jgi:hypothetical protein
MLGGLRVLKSRGSTSSAAGKGDNGSGNRERNRDIMVGLFPGVETWGSAVYKPIQSWPAIPERRRLLGLTSLLL